MVSEEEMDNKLLEIRDKIIEEAMKARSILVEDLIESIPFKRKITEIFVRYFSYEI